LLGVFGPTHPTATGPSGAKEVKLSFQGTGDAKTWDEAFQKVVEGGQILLQDTDITQPLRVGDNKGYIHPVPKNVTIAPAPGKSVRWHPASAKPEDRLIMLYKAENLTIRGDITLDGGESKLNELLSVNHSCPGLVLDGLTLMNYTRCGVLLGD